ncbi:MAG: U32 family peptidase [Ruminococcaceae bacterium]|nr:U32 family peptidase [Oscillospiraceae bacterium]
MHELLAPAGSFEALRAAIEAGADAVYLGPDRHNARLSGENFTEDTLLDAVRYCHTRHKKVYMTLNTLLSDQELEDMVDYIPFLSKSGIDAVIVQDIGLASLLRNALPDLPLHASTQMTIHNARGIARAQALGFQRVVLAREAFSRDLIRSSPLEIEVFIHGALCVSYSGQCYFSSMLARRSGNRGTCAQPCRHRYKEGYALSLHDLCLAQHMPEILSLPIASLKIEGRLKSPDYVRGVVSVYRRLIDEKRAATKEEMDFLTQLFSRQGFTDGYFTGKKGRAMFGFRTDADKLATKAVSVPPAPETKIPLKMHLTVQDGAPSRLLVTDGIYSVSAVGDIPQKAASRPLTQEDCVRSLAKTGGTPYAAEITAEIEDGLFLSAASLNAIRRTGLENLYNAAMPVREIHTVDLSVPHRPAKQTGTQCIFQNPGQIPENLNADFIWLPLFSMESVTDEKTGAVLPTILFDNELPPVQNRLKQLQAAGLRHVMCHTIGQSLLCRELGLTPHGGTGMHIYNSRTAALSDMESLIASPELLSTQLRQMPKPIPLSVIVYGRHTLMTMENCLALRRNQCHNGKGTYSLTDEKGNIFPVLCAYPHRNEVLNSRPVYMLDKLDTLRSAGLHSFILRFTTESRQEVSEIMDLYRAGAPAPFPFTRGAFYQKEASAKNK